MREVGKSKVEKKVKKMTMKARRNKEKPKRGTL